MRIARFWLNDEARYGVVDGPELRVLDGHPLVNGYEYTGDRVAMKDVKLLAPTVPSKIVCIGKNYADHIAEIAQPGDYVITLGCGDVYRIIPQILASLEASE